MKTMTEFNGVPDIRDRGLSITKQELRKKKERERPDPENTINLD